MHLLLLLLVCYGYIQCHCCIFVCDKITIVYHFVRQRYLYLTVGRKEMGARERCDMQQRSSSRDSNQGPLPVWHALLTTEPPVRWSDEFIENYLSSSHILTHIWFICFSGGNCSLTELILASALFTSDSYGKVVCKLIHRLKCLTCQKYFRRLIVEIPSCIILVPCHRHGSLPFHNN